MNDSTIEDIITFHRAGIDRRLAISRREYAGRWSRVQKAMRSKGYDLGYACGSELDRSDVAWLAGVFDPIIERYGVLVPALGKPVVIAGSEGGHVIADCLRASGAELALLKEYQISDEDYRFAQFETLDDVVNRLVPFRPGRPVKIALFSSSQFMPYDHAVMFQGRFGADNVVFDLELLRRIKYPKSPAELKIIGPANRIADAAFLGMLAALEPGVRELDVAAAGDAVMKRLGAGRTRARDNRGRPRTPREPYTFIHNTGCSECQEGYGAVTPYSKNPLPSSAALMIDVAFLGFDGRGGLVFPIEYAVIEDAFWKKGRDIGVYNRLPLSVQDLVGKDLVDVPAKTVNPYHRKAGGGR